QNQQYEFYAALQAWDEAAANFINRTATQTWQQPGARGAADRGTTVLGTITAVVGLQTYNLNSAGNAVVQQWIAGGTTANNGLVISDDFNTNGGIVDSSEVGNVNNRPRLTIAYTTAPPADATPPSVPTGLFATDNGASTINLSWNFSTDAESGVSFYKVYRNNVLIGSPTQTSFMDAGRTPGVSYSYTVSAVNGVSLESAQSSPPVSRTIAVDSTAPSAPTNVSATDDGISQITLSWTAAVDAQSGISQYKIFRDGVEVGVSSTTSFVDTGRTPNVNYSYQVSAVNGQNLQGPQSTPALVHKITPLPITLRLQTRDSYLPGTPMLVRVEITGADGLPDRTIWDATATLSSTNPAVTLSTSTVQLRNGIGSALVTFSGSGNFTLQATAMGLNSSKSLTSLAGAAQTNVAGTLSGAQLNWNGVVHVTGNVTVPDGQTLTVAPGTLVLIDGAPDNRPNLVTNGITITVNGTMNAIGTAAQPISFTSTGPTLYWGEINHSTSDGVSRYTYVDVLHAGHSPGGDHTGHGPAIRSTNSTLEFDHANITDIVGKTMRAQGSNLTFRHSIIGRSAMGPETFSTGLLFENSYIFDMLHTYRQDNVNDDDDGIYVHRQGAGQEIRFSGCIVANADDDGIDHLGADMTVDGCIIRDMVNTADDPKGITIIEGTNFIRNTLLVNVDIGISAKGQGAGAPVSNNTLDHVTIVANTIGIQAEDKFGIPGAIINYNVTNSIIRAADPVASDYAPGPIVINYSNLVTETWPGTGNITSDPLFVSVPANNYRLQAVSPAIDAGDPASPVDADGTRTDMGFYTFFHHPRVAEVLVRGSAWSQVYLDRLAADGLGQGGYRVPLNAATPPILPFANIDRIMVRFTEGVSVAATDLVLHGVNTPNYTVGTMSYDPATFTATWSLPTRLGIDKLALRVEDSVLDLTGSALDGEPNASYPSGNNSPGGDFTFRFNVLPGDLNATGTGTRADVALLALAGFRSTASAGYQPLADVDGSGAINHVDAVRVRDSLGRSLPAGNPAPSPPAPSPPAIESGSTTLPGARLRRVLPAGAVDSALEAEPLDDGTLRAGRKALRVLEARRSSLRPAG
ncbi:MAG: fibronectin type III domain-containing protein, partial [Pirellulales bacterium]